MALHHEQAACMGLIPNLGDCLERFEHLTPHSTISYGSLAIAARVQGNQSFHTGPVAWFESAGSLPARVTHSSISNLGLRHLTAKMRPSNAPNLASASSGHLALP